MKHLTCLLPLLLLPPLVSQNVVTIGGTGTSSSGAARGKANVFQVDTTTLLLNIEMWLNVPAAPETLTFFLFRHHSRNGVYTLQWSKPVLVTGTGSFAWYSSGPVTLDLVGGNHYQIGVSWGGTVGYTYLNTSTPGTPLPFGNWQRATTHTNPPASTFSVSGNDSAQYYQRFTWLPLSSVAPVGKGCSSATLPPRTVAGLVARVGGSLTLDLVDATLSAPALYLLGFAPTLPVPIPLFGCSFWLDPFTPPLIEFSATTSSTGVANLALPIPSNPALAGLRIATQCGVVNGANIDLSNAIDIVVQ